MRGTGIALQGGRQAGGGTAGAAGEIEAGQVGGGLQGSRFLEATLRESELSAFRSVKPPAQKQFEGRRRQNQVPPVAPGPFQCAAGFEPVPDGALARQPGAAATWLGKTAVRSLTLPYFSSRAGEPNRTSSQASARRRMKVRLPATEWNPWRGLDGGGGVKTEITHQDATPAAPRASNASRFG